MPKSCFNLNDKIFRTSLDAISLMPENPIVVGGAAIQIHAAQNYSDLRNTPDLDILIGKNLSDYTQFVSSFFSPVHNFLMRNGFHSQPKKGRLNNAVKVMKNPNHQDEEDFLINLTYFNQGVYECFKDYIAKQIDNAQTAIFPFQHSPIKVASLEEVLPLKLQRAIRHGTDRENIVGVFYPTLIEQAKNSDWESLAAMPIRDWKPGLDRIQSAVNDSSIDYDKRSDARSAYKLSKDSYDICLAAKVICDANSTFNNDRYKENLNRIIDRACPDHTLSE